MHYPLEQRTLPWPILPVGEANGNFLMRQAATAGSDVLRGRQRVAGAPGRAASERHEVPVLVTRGVPARGADVLEEVEVS